MSTMIQICEESMKVRIRINDDYTVQLVDFSAIQDSKELIEHNEAGLHGQSYAPILEVQITGESPTNMHGYKHNSSSASGALHYIEREEKQNNYGKKLEITMEAENGLRAVYHMQFYTGLQVVRVWSVLTNIGTEDLGLEYVSSFMYQGICKNGAQPYYEKTDVYVPYNSWDSEAQWKKYDAEDLHLTRMLVDGYNLPGFGLNRYTYGSLGSWSSCQYLPMGFVRDRETNEIYFFQIEHSGAWLAEYGSGIDKQLYLTLSGPTENEASWWKNLKPGMSFTTVPAAFGVVLGDETEATAELTKYRRAIRRPNIDNENCYVVFNDYMNCLMGDPTEEKEMQIIDKAAEIGCEYYCLDCGWYDKGIWWDRVGEWKESPERFPNGLKTVFDYARSKGMKMGLWLEIEVMGTACELAATLPDDWFFCRHGKRHIDNKRYLLDFRNPDVYKYCMDVVDRMVADYGAEFFKIDYNVTTNTGSDLYSDSLGDAMLEHYRCLYQWYREIYAKYPNLVIENCGSGGMRMDYGMLELQSLQSTSDQTDYIYNSHIAANVATAVTPEQAGMWVYPYVDEAEHVIYNMVNGMLLRPYVSGLVWDMSQENLDLLAEGIAIYKDIRNDLKVSTPFFPLGLCDIKDDVLAYGVQKYDVAYLSVFTPKTDKASIPLHLEKPIQKIEVLYPKAQNCTFDYTDGVLNIEMPQKAAARFFKLYF